MALSGMSGSGNGNVVQSKRSLGVPRGEISTAPITGDGVVLKTKERNQAANNPGGVGGSGRTNPNSPLRSSSGPSVISTKGRTVAGTNKTIG